MNLGMKYGMNLGMKYGMILAELLGGKRMGLGRESETVEFKKTTGEIEEALIAMVAMLNKHHEGTIYFGVNNDGEIVGQSIGEGTLRDISQQVAQKIDPKIFPTIEKLQEGNLSYIRVTFNGKETPYSIGGRTYIRMADQNRLASRNEIRKLFMLGGSDLLRGRPSLNKDLTFHHLFSKLRENNIPTKEGKTFLNSLGLLTEDGEYNFQAELLSDQNDISILISRFQTEDKTILASRDDYGHRPLYESIDAVLDTLSHLNETSISMDGSGQRRETKLFDELALREAWVNAIAHNDWLSLNPPSVYVYSNRLEIVSTGGIPLDMSREDFFSNISQPINPSLFALLSNLHYTERTGHGIELIKARYGESAFTLSENFLSVSLKFSFRPTWAYTSLPSNLTDTQKRILLALYRDEQLTLTKLSVTENIPLPTIKSAVASLQKKGLLKRIGTSQKGTWKVIL